MRSLAAIFLTFLTLLAQAASAQDLPTRVGRVAYIEGPVSIYQDPELGWDKAYVNSPVTSENSLWTEPGARAEVRVGGLAMRLDGATQLDISHLDDDGIDAHVERGTAVIRVRHFDRNDRYRFSTPHGSFRLLADGRYRIEVDPERDETRVTVTSGAADLESGRRGIRVDPGRMIVVYGGSSPSYVFERVRADGFDRWADGRDRLWTESVSARYVSPDITGYEDLDRYGSWVQEPDYGPIWYPSRVASGWAPYRHGHWSYVRPWGWTWIDDQPWGYAPSHYGRWVYVGNRWGWHPGERVRRQAWAPALVGWIGGSNWSVGVSSGARAPAVGWYPLSPWERYEPWYRASPAYVSRINIIVQDRDRAPRNWQGRGDDWRRWNRDLGSTVVQRDAFIQRRPVNQAMVQVTPDQVRQQPQAQASTVLPTQNELQRFRTQQGERAQPQQAQPQPQQAQQSPQQGQQGPRGRGDDDRRDRSRRDERPNFARPPSTLPPPVPAAQAPQVQPGAPRSTADVMNPGARNLQQPAAPAPAPQANPLGRGDDRQREAQERAAREAKQQQERVAREAQQNQERAAREAQQQQERAAREAQQNQERAAREARQNQERAAREAQQQNQLQQQNQQREQQQRAAREAQQQQERAAREAQQQQERAAREAQQQQQQQQLQRQQREAQQQQERAAREAQQQQERAAREAQQAQQRAAQQQERAAREAQQKAPEAQNQLQRQPREQPKQDKPEKDKQDKAEKDKQEREERGGGRQR